MKKILTIAACATALLCSCTSNAQKTTADEGSSNDQANTKVLVAYYSATGTTEGVAKQIADATNGKLYAITPEAKYTDEDLDWHNKQSRSSVEMADSTSRPPIAGEKIDAAEYDVIFIGFPIWWDLAPRVVNTWIESQPGLKGKKVYAFATSGGSTIDNSANDLRRLYPDINWQQPRLLNQGSNPADWAKQAVK